MPRRNASGIHPAPSENLHLALARKVVLLALIMLVLPMALVLLFLNIQIPFPLFAVIFYVLFFGLLAGLAVRFVLGSRTRMLRIIASFAIPLGSLLLLGWFTGWRYGIEPLRWGREDVGWLELLQVLGSAALSLLVLSAWTRPRPPLEPVTTPLVGISESVAVTRPNRRIRTGADRARLEKTQKVRAQSNRRRSGKHHIRLSREEEHRCPYCLEIIEPGDPRGTVECRVCHTLHHADCWAITGACQVPHYST